MTHHKKIFVTTMLLLSIMYAGGCGGEEEQVESKPAVRAQPKKPPPPPKKSLDDIRREVHADARIFWAEEEASFTNAEREAIFIFFTAILKNDHETLRPMLSMQDQLELSTLAASTEFVATLNAVSRVDIRTGSDPLSGDSVVLAIYEVGMDYQPQFWSFEEADGTLEFSALQSPPDLVHQLGGDWIKEYFKGRAEFLAKLGNEDEEGSYQLAGDDTTSAGSNSPSSPGGIPQMPGSPRPNQPGRPGPSNPGRGPMTP